MRIESDLTIAIAEISAFTEQVSDFLSENGVDARATHHVALVLEELLSNLATHGDSLGQKASVSITITAEGVQGEVIDSGAPFDPRAATDPDVEAPIADRPIGGLGLVLVKRLTSALDYVRRDNRNVTTFAVTRTIAGARDEE